MVKENTLYDMQDAFVNIYEIMWYQMVILK